MDDQVYPWQRDAAGFLSRVFQGLPFDIHSGYRNPSHNAAVGGVGNSDHLDNNAFDVGPKPGSGVSMSQLADAAATSGVPFNQLINEGSNVHVAFHPSGDRNQTLAMNGAPAPPQVMQGQMQGGGQPAPVAPTNDPELNFVDAALAHHGGPTTQPAAPSGDPETDFVNAALAHHGNVSQSPMPNGGQSPVTKPTDFATQALGSGYGSLFHGMMNPVYGANQDIYKGIQGAANLGGYALGVTPQNNPVGQWAGNMANNFTGQKQAADTAYGHALNATGNNGLMSKVNDILGNVISPANVVTALTGGTSALGRMLLQGGTSAATQPTSTTGDKFWGEKGTQVGEGMGINALLHGAGSAVGAVANPIISKSAKILMDAGIPLTAGQVMGGTARTMEDASTSIPVVGDIIKNRRLDSFKALSSAMVNRSLAPIGQKLPAGVYGHDAIAAGQQALSDAYDHILPRMSGTADPQLSNDLANVLNNPGQYQITPSQVTTLKGFIDNNIVGRANKGNFDGDTLKAVQADISDQIRRATRGAAAPGDYNYADALGDIRTGFNQFIQRQNPAEAPQLAAIDSGYRNLVVAEKAAGSATNGVFSAAQLGNAVRQGGTRKALARGTASNQDLSNAARDILPSTLPDSGTPIRHAVQALEIGVPALVGGHMAAPETTDMALPAVAGAAGLGSILAAGATRPAQKAIVSLLTKRPYSPATAAQLANLLKSGAPIAGRALVPSLVASGNNVPPN